MQLSPPSVWFRDHVSGRLAEMLAVRPAVVLERVARGGGATNWFYVTSPGQLGELAARFRPGSSVSFYFDDRIKCTMVDDEFIDDVLDIVVADGEAVVGFLAGDGLELDVDFVAGLGDLTEMLGARGSGTVAFVGAFPARDDGVDAVTFDLPDADGVVRRHPH
jgi:hypothetical protein